MAYNEADLSSEAIANRGRGARERRYLCSELVDVRYQAGGGRQAALVGNLEEIWKSGARLLVETPVPPRARLVFRCRQASFRATVTACVRDFLGYFLEVSFEEGSRWSPRKARPKHLFDPARLLPAEGPPVPPAPPPA
jgi:hypothetical protein